MKIYTKTGDDGETGLLGGVRVSKADAVIATTGDLDELNSWLGLVRSHCQSEPQLESAEGLDRWLQRLQNELFDLGARVASCMAESQKSVEFSMDKVHFLEHLIDQIDAEIPALTAFILPSGAVPGSMLHLARTVCRRAERQLVQLNMRLTADGRNPLSIEQTYLNRLSDLLFVMARFVNHALKKTETQWQAERG